MRIHILSDLHLEFAPFQPNHVDADVDVLAGDIHTGKNGIKWILKTFPDRPVIYVLGNHEFYGQKLPNLSSETKVLAQGTNVHVLEQDRVEIGDVVFLGTTLWTDFRLKGDPILAGVVAQAEMNDFRLIRLVPTYRRLRPGDAQRVHAQSVEWLVQEAEKARGKKVVVVSHHAPSLRSIAPEFRHDSLSPAYASNLEPLLAESGAAFWIHGHLHHRSDYTIGACRVLANPRGYPREPHTGFDSALVVVV